MRNMARQPSDRRPEYFLILSNLPESVGRQPSNTNWQPVKDLIYSHIDADDREFGRIDIVENNVAVCRMQDLDQRRQAYDALQGHSWRNVTLKAWLCEKRGNVMQQTAGPVDRRTASFLSAPGPLVRMSPTLARRIGCAPFPPFAAGLPSPQNSPHFGMTFVPFVPRAVGVGHPCSCSPQMVQTSHHHQHGAEVASAPTPPLSQISRTSSSSTISAFQLSDTPGHPQFRGSPSTPGTPFISQAGSVADSSSTSTTPNRPSSTASIPRSPSLTQGRCGSNKIKIQNFSSLENVEALRHILESDFHLYIVKIKAIKGNSRPHVFITFSSDRDAEIVMQQLNGQTVFGSRLNVRLDNQPRWSGFPSGKLSSGVTPNLQPRKDSVSGKSSIKFMAKLDAVEKPVRKGPVIIDGSLD